MKFAEAVKTFRANGTSTKLFRRLYSLNLMSIERIGTFAEQLGNSVRLDGVTISMDNPRITTYIKGMLMLDMYENNERQLILKHLSPDEPVIELGASIGVVACTVNRRLRAPTRHVVVEANPDLIPTLKKNRDINRCQFDVIQAAIGYGSDTTPFFYNDLSTTGGIYGTEGKTVEVPVTSLQAIAENAKFRHFTLMSDIEGSEIELIEHEMDFIRKHVDTLIIELHYYHTPFGEEGADLALEKLEMNGFEFIERNQSNYCFRNSASLRDA